MDDRTGFLRAKLDHSEPLSAVERSECLRLRLNPEGKPRHRPHPEYRNVFA